MQGQLSKMSCRADTEVQYTLALGDATQDMNALIGQRVRLEFLQKIICQPKKASLRAIVIRASKRSRRAIFVL
jgi:hypothetical protein